MKLVPLERVQRIDEDIVEVPFPQITEEIAEEFKNCTVRAIIGEDL